jgi:hypothetical protein
MRQLDKGTYDFLVCIHFVCEKRLWRSASGLIASSSNSARDSISRVSGAHFMYSSSGVCICKKAFYARALRRSGLLRYLKIGFDICINKYTRRRRTYKNNATAHFSLLNTTFMNM